MVSFDLKGVVGSSSSEGSKSGGNWWDIRSKVDKLVKKWSGAPNGIEVSEAQVSETVSQLAIVDEKAGESKFDEERRLAAYERTRLVKNGRGAKFDNQLRLYYGQVREKLTQEKEFTSVEKVSNKYGALCLHGINGTSTVLYGADWKTCVETVLMYEPIEISTSLVFPNEVSRNSIWHDEGVILSKGGITFASETNVWSRVDENGRVANDKNGSQDKTTAVGGILSKKGQSVHHNEVFVARPRVSAYYVSVPEGEEMHRMDKERYDFLEKTGVPVVMLYRGECRNCNYDESTGCLVPSGKEVLSTDITNHSVELNDNQKDEIIDDLRTKNPFGLGMEPATAYLKGLNFPDNQDTFNVDTSDPERKLSTEEALMLCGYIDWSKQVGFMPENDEAALWNNIEPAISRGQYEFFKSKFKDGKLALTREDMASYLRGQKIDWFGTSEIGVKENLK